MYVDLVDHTCSSKNPLVVLMLYMSYMLQLACDYIYYIYIYVVYIYIYIQLFGAEYGKLQNAVACEVGSGPIGRWETLSFFGSLTPHLVGNIWIVVETAVVTPF
jgi:hypothetical protein